MKSFKAHSTKQETVLISKKRIVILTCGVQFGKSLSGVVWLKQQMHTYTDPSDNFLVTSPTYKILAQSTLPPFMQVMEGCGTLDKQNYVFRMNGGGSCWFRTGQNPDSPVGITNVRAILCDEAGLYTRYFKDNIFARASFKQAPIRIVTSPYSLNWLYQDFIRPWMKGDPFIHDLCDIVQATSKENPYFPDEEYEQRKRTMDPRRFNMIYGGKFDKADGLVYQNFSLDRHVCEVKQLEPGTQFYGAIDWGYTDPFVVIIRAIDPYGMHYDIGEVYKPGLTLSGMIDNIRRLEHGLGIVGQVKRYEADPSRPDYINELCRAGITCVPANNDIRMGIDLHYELIESGKYKVFAGRCPHLLDEYELYHYPELKDLKPDQGQKDELPVDKDNHAMDCGRYLTCATYKRFGHTKNRFVTHTQREKEKSVFQDLEAAGLRKKKKLVKPTWL